MYRYFGIVFGYLRRRVTMLSARLDKPTAHAAVWAGCNDRTRSWVQGGIKLDDIEARTPDAYIELKGPDVAGGYSIRSWPVAYGKPVKVALTRSLRDRSKWRVSVSYRLGDGRTVTRRSPFVRVPSPTIDATVETLGQAHCVAKIGFKTVRA